MSSSRGSNASAAKEAAYNRQNSPIFAPFMIHVVCNLLNQSKPRHEPHINVESTVALWGGGLKQLRECYSEWDQRVNECCKTTPIHHPIWKKFIQYHHNSNTTAHVTSSTAILETLLQIWHKTGEQNHNYGPYPSPFEQREYQSVCMIPMGYLQHAIMDFQFEPAFKANKLDLETVIAQKQRQTMDEDSNEDEKEMKHEALDPMNPLNDTMPWQYDEIIHRSGGRSDTSNNFTGYTMNNEASSSPRGARNRQQNKAGILYYQSVHFTAHQCANIATYFNMNKSAAPLILFGDNNVDKERDKRCEKRQFFGGQAESVGVYDNWFAFGITTTWKHKPGSGYFQGNMPPPEVHTFTRLMDAQFSSVAQHLQNGYDVIVPTPTMEDMARNRDKYYDDSGVLRVKHNLGTGIANLDIKYLSYIQRKLEELERYASSVKRISYCQIYDDTEQEPTRENHMNRNNAMWNINNLPFDTHHPIQSNRKGNNENNTRQRLAFDAEEKRSATYTAAENRMNGDPFGPLRYESPQHRPQKRHKYVQNKDINEQSNEYTAAEEKERGRDARARMNEFHTPSRHISDDNNNNGKSKKRWPHYRSPSGYADQTEYYELSSPKKGTRVSSPPVESQSRASPHFRNKRKKSSAHRNDANMMDDAINWCLMIMFFYPRQLYMALVIQNKPQDVIKLMSLLCIACAAISFVISWHVTSGTLVWIGLAVFFALAGGDHFYQQSRERHSQRHTFYQ